MSKKRHLSYDSIEDWMAGENVPEDFVETKDVKLRDKYISEYGELKRHLFAKHVATLSEADQRLFSDRKHPSQSHAFASDAEPYCKLLNEYLNSIGIIADEITLGWYHMDRTVLTVRFSTTAIESASTKRPWLFRGFEVFYFPKRNKDAT